MSSPGLPPVPSVDDYRKAFRALRARGALTSGHLKMLSAQYYKPGHAVTAAELATAAGYKDSNGANLQYGILGKMLRDELNYREEGQASYISSEFAPPKSEGNDNWLFYMHPEVVDALRAEAFLTSG